MRQPNSRCGMDQRLHNKGRGDHGAPCRKEEGGTEGKRGRLGGYCHVKSTALPLYPYSRKYSLIIMNTRTRKDQELQETMGKMSMGRENYPRAHDRKVRRQVMISALSGFLKISRKQV